jgi:hypothetical protein
VCLRACLSGLSPRPRSPSLRSVQACTKVALSQRVRTAAAPKSRLPPMPLLLLLTEVVCVDRLTSVHSACRPLTSGHQTWCVRWRQSREGGHHFLLSFCAVLYCSVLGTTATETKLYYLEQPADIKDAQERVGTGSQERGTYQQKVKKEVKTGETVKKGARKRLRNR